MADRYPAVCEYNLLEDKNVMQGTVLGSRGNEYPLWVLQYSHRNGQFLSGCQHRALLELFLTAFGLVFFFKVVEKANISEHSYLSLEREYAVRKGGTAFDLKVTHESINATRASEASSPLIVAFTGCHSLAECTLPLPLSTPGHLLADPSILMQPGKVSQLLTSVAL